METNETFEPLTPAPGLTLSLEAQSYLREAGKWAYFLGILGFIGCALILIAAFSIGAIFSKLAEISPNPTFAVFAGAGSFVTVFYLLIDVLYFFFSFYLFQFGDKVKKGVQYSDSIHLTSGLSKLKSFFKLWGILTIVLLALYAIIIVVAIIAAMAGGAMHH